MKISAILIARNEAANIRACLESIAWVDEIIVVEQGSEDTTAHIAAECGARVIQMQDWPGFGPQKNRGLEAATGDWVLSIDADERVSPELAREIQQAITDADASGQSVIFELPRLTQFCGVWIRHCGWSPDPVLRVFRRGEARFSDDLVHERLVVQRKGSSLKLLKNRLEHYSYPTPEHYWRKLQRYSHDWAVQRHMQGQTTTMARAALSGLAAFTRSYLFRMGFLDGAMGFAVCTMQAQAAFGKYFELYCLERLNGKL